MTTTTRTTTYTVITFALACLMASACATAPRPDSLQRATDRMGSSEVTRLSASHPNFVEKARVLVSEASTAWQQGDQEVADLKGRMALQQIDTASNFDARSQALARRKAMKSALEEVNQEASAVERESRSLQLYQEAEARFRNVESELGQLRADDNSRKAQAQRALVASRKLQSQAIGVGAPTKAPEVYNEGRFLLETALEALENGLYAESSSASQQATARFEASIEASGASAADALKRSEAEAKNAESQKAVADKARAAIDEAEGARALAIANNMPTQSKALYEQGSYLLQLANTRFERKDFGLAEARATEALKVFKTPPSAGQGFQNNVGGPVIGVAQGNRPSGGGSDAFRSEVEQRLISIQYERAEALGSELDEKCPGTFSEFEALLELGIERFQAGDYPRAVEFAIRATERLKRCDPASTTAGAASAGGTAGLVDRVEAAAERKKKDIAARQIGKAQRLIARVSSKGGSGADLKEPALLVADAKSWFTSGDYDEAANLAAEATKLLEAIERKARTAPAGAAKKAGAPAAVKGGAKAKGAKDTAATAATKPVAVCKDFATKLNDARVAQAAVGSRVTSPEAEKRYRRAITASLSAERLAGEGRCADAEFLLTEATSVFEGFASDGYVDPKEVGKVDPKTVPKVSAKSPCPDLHARINDLNLGLKVRTGQITGVEQERQLRRASSLARSVGIFQKKGACDETVVLLEEAFSILATLEPGDKSDTSKVAGVTAPREKTTTPGVTAPASSPLDEAMRQSAMGTIGRAEVLKASRAQYKSSNVYQTGDRLLGQARSLLDAGKGAEALRVSEQAVFAFESIEVKGEQPTATANSKDDGAWKAAYKVILDTLVERDRAVSAAQTKDEKETLQRGLAFVNRSEGHWGAKDYVAAERFSKAALEEFKAVLNAAKAREAKMSLDEKKKLADQKRALDKEKDDLKKREATAVRRRAAEAKLQVAETSRIACEHKKCAERDASAWSDANAAMAEARLHIDNGKFNDSEAAAKKAKAIFDKLAETPTFTMPQGVTGVQVRDDKIVVDEAIQFVTRKDTIAPASMATVRSIAKVLVANVDALNGVVLIGYTDSRGNARRNLELSRRRASALRAALIVEGVPARLIEAIGRGDADPVADNGTRKGRALNRRVEIMLKFEK